MDLGPIFDMMADIMAKFDPAEDPSTMPGGIVNFDLLPILGKYFDPREGSSTYGSPPASFEPFGTILS